MVNEAEMLGLTEFLFYKEALDNKQCTEQTNYTASDKLMGCGKHELEGARRIGSVYWGDGAAGYIAIMVLHLDLIKGNI